MGMYELTNKQMDDIIWLIHKQEFAIKQREYKLSGKRSKNCWTDLREYCQAIRDKQKEDIW
jgi:hypothetical protein